MKTEEDLKKDGWGFHRGDGFVYYRVDSGFGSIRSFCAGNKDLKEYVDKLIASGERVVFTHYNNQIGKNYYFDEYHWMYKGGNLILLSYGEDTSFLGGEQKIYQRELKNIDEIFEVAAKETNVNREEYNRILDQTYLVTNFRFHSCPITFVSNHFAKGWTIFLQTEKLYEKSYYSLFATNRDRTVFKRLPFGEGDVERVIEHGSVIIAKSKLQKDNEEDIIAHVTFTVVPQTEKTKLSMLTKENVFQESVFCPLPFKEEPIIR